jgi:uncharacterized repeat protein (TIGR03803 family)
MYPDIVNGPVVGSMSTMGGSVIRHFARIMTLAPALTALLAVGLLPCGAQTFNTLVNFMGDINNSPDQPMALIQGRDGNFYGTSTFGGKFSFSDVEFGTVFKMTPAGEASLLHTFYQSQQLLDGTLPYAGLVQGTDGNFYGTTDGQGDNNGSVFKITPDGTLIPPAPTAVIPISPLAPGWRLVEPTWPILPIRA